MRISVIIPVYNKAPFLARCFKSVRQSILALPDAHSVQVIVIDDGSTDGSADICKDATRFGFEVYCSKENKGVSAQRNFGMRKASGDYITFLDADDAFTVQSLASMCLAGSTGTSHNIYQFGHARYLWGADASPKLAFGATGWCGLNVLPDYKSMVWNKMFRRSFLEAQDIDFIVGMPFGEDEMFSSECILANGGLQMEGRYITVNHYFDDKKSICRGGLCREWLEDLERSLEQLRDRQTDPARVAWVQRAIDQHRRSKTWARFGVGRGRTR